MNITSYILSKQYIDDIVSNSDLLKGKSAYDIAVEQGFIGSEAEWLESLKGESPYIGENGNWFLGDIDLGVVASQNLDGYYNENNLTPLTANEILAICEI